MIQIENVSKHFGDICALQNVTAGILENCIFGLVGTNGAGKSTLLRILAGVLAPDSGSVLVDEMPVWENPAAKERICFLADTAVFSRNATAETMRACYQCVYPGFDGGRFDMLLEKFDLDPRRKLSTFSKGMKKQVSVLLGICANTKYQLCDETLDGQDPVMRQTVKSLFANEMLNRPFTPVIASHSLREIEDICDTVGLLHKGGILFAKDLDEMKLGIHKLQCVLPGEVEEEALLAKLDVLKKEKRGSMLTIVARGKESELKQKIMEAEPLFHEILPLSLEEIFISEMGVTGYEIKDLVY